MASYLSRWRNTTPTGPTSHTDWSPLQPQSKKQDCRTSQTSSHECLSLGLHKQVGIAKHGCVMPCLRWNKMITYRRDGHGTILKIWGSLYFAGLRGFLWVLSSQLYSSRYRFGSGTGSSFRKFHVRFAYGMFERFAVTKSCPVSWKAHLVTGYQQTFKQQFIMHSGWEIFS